MLKSLTAKPSLQVLPRAVTGRRNLFWRLRSSTPSSLRLPTWRGYQAGFQRSMCCVENRRGSLPSFYRFTGDTKDRLESLAGLRLCGQRIEMEDQPLLLNSALDLWPWGYFRLGFLASFGKLSGLRCSALFSLFEWRVEN